MAGSKVANNSGDFPQSRFNRLPPVFSFRKYLSQRKVCWQGRSVWYVMLIEALQMFCFANHRVIPWCLSSHGYILPCVPAAFQKVLHEMAPQLSDHCDVITNRLWRHGKDVNREDEARGRHVKLIVSNVICVFVICGNQIMYALSWRRLYLLTRVLFIC